MTTDERLEKMEAQLAHVRWINRCLVAGMVVCLAVWGLTQALDPATAWAQSGTKEIRATKFIVEDENGRSRAELFMGRDGPGLVLRDEDAKGYVLLGIDKFRKFLVLGHENGRAGLELSLGKAGPEVMLTDESGKNRAVLMAIKGGPQLRLLNENGKAWNAP
jgi:hypothetical protein